MKLRTKALIITLILAITVAFTGCGGNSAEAKKYADSWYDKAGQKTIIKIEENESKDGFNVQIAQATSNTSEYLWTMTCTYNKDTGDLEYSDAVKTNHAFDSDGNETKDEEYTDGAGSFHLEEERITWTDQKDDAGAGCSFFRFDDVVKDMGQ